MAYTDAQIDAKIDANNQAIDLSIDTKILASKAPPISAAANAAAAANPSSIGQGINPWGEALKSKDGYLGNFFAAGQVRAGAGDSSWANVDVDPVIAATAVRLLDIDAALKLATHVDGDIDGKSNTGTSTVKEGEEKFVFGASYSGLQGIGISEITGISANYVKGKRVFWLAGDHWALHQDGSVFSESYVDESSTTIKAKGAVISLTEAESVKSITISRLENYSYRQSTANVSTINVGGSTAEIIVGALTSNAYLNAVKATVNVSGALITASLIGKAVDINKFIAGKYKKTSAPIIVENNDVAVQVSSGTGIEINSINTEIASVITRIEKMQTQLEMKARQISKLESSIISAGFLVEGGGSAIGNWDISMNEASARGEVSNTRSIKTMHDMKISETSLSTGGSRITSMKCDIFN